MSADGPEKLVFVGGAPRSGTTVTHALICTSEKVCEYHPEISFLRAGPMAFRNGRMAWKQHTHAFFENSEDFRRLMRDVCTRMIGPVWKATGSSPILAMKDPLLTPYFRDLHEIFEREAWFVVVIRHPFDVVRSREEVHRKSNPSRSFGIVEASAAARDYVATYQSILEQGFSGRLFMFRYEDLNTPRILSGLQTFLGVDDLDRSRMWGREVSDPNDPWGSPKYNGPIDLEPRLSVLAPDLAEHTRAICAPIMERFGYR